MRCLPLSVSLFCIYLFASYSSQPNFLQTNITHSKNKHVIAFELYRPNNNSCKRRREGMYIMEVGKFARAYVAQKKEDYDLYGKDYGDADALDYLECTEVYYNDVVVSLFDIGC